ncbi:MAG: DUF4097 domain-containing protein [Flavobacteriaceae bacterium]|nr:DUF4097 domain-containing protein [Flavobacteriaceae bacterium]
MKNVYQLLVVMAALVWAPMQAQETKTYRENFLVKPNTVISLNTSYTDVVFETWDKKEVEVEASITVDEVSAEKAQRIFDAWGFEAMGNSSKINIRTGRSNQHYSKTEFLNKNFELEEFEINIPDLSVVAEIAPFVGKIVPEVLGAVRIPPIPPIRFDSYDFDYDRYKEEGDAYLKRWKKKYKKDSDKEFERQVREWKQSMERYEKEMEQMGERIGRQADAAAARLERRIEGKTKVVEEKIEKAAKKANKKKGNRLIIAPKNDRNVWILSDEDHWDKDNVKRKIIIRMPKGSKLDIDVRHGEIKMASVIKNIKATLNHSRLLASKIDGEETEIKTAYTPVEVDMWNHGMLEVAYTKDVVLKKVGRLNLNAKTADITIGELKYKALINGNFGNLNIQNTASSFKSIDVFVDNTDARIRLPKSVAYQVYLNGMDSEIAYPEHLKVETTNSFQNTLVKGYNKSSQTDKTVNITARYSQVVVR